jgi:hypothetical protein
MTELPIACSLTADAASQRAEEFRELAARALVGRRRTGSEVVLRFQTGEGVAEQVASLAERERECCPFLAIDVERRDGEVALRIGAEPDARGALDVFYELAG